MSAAQPEPQRQPGWFLALFALASAGGAVAFVPLLTVLLPQQIASLQGHEDVAALAQVTFLGAVVASLANIGVGMLSDRSRTRRPWIVAGLVLSNIMLLQIGGAVSVGEVVVLVMLWQVGLNLMLAPLMAWAGDCFPDSQKGLLGGALALSPALGALQFINAMGVQRFVARSRELARQHGARFEPAAILVQMAQENRRFQDA